MADWASDDAEDYNMEIDDESPWSSPVRGRGRGESVRGCRGRGRGQSIRGRRGRGGARGGRGSGGVRGRGRGGVTGDFVAQRKEKVKELLGKMDEAGVRQVLADVVDKQPGLLFDLLDYSAIAGAGYHPSANAQTLSWCVYCHCREMRTDMESVCCGYTQEHCVSQLPHMESYVLDEGVLGIARTFRREMMVFPMASDENKGNRHAAYRQFIMWCHGRLGAGNRLVIPSCCVWRIRDKFPDKFNTVFYREGK